MAVQLSTRTPVLLLLETAMIVVAVTVAAAIRLGPAEGLAVIIDQASRAK